MKERILSVDIFRGMTIILMILVNTPGTWADVYAPLRHADWHGYTPTDLVFPFFLFIVGTSIVFAYRNKEATAATHKKILIRSLKLIGLGLFLGAFSVEFPFVKDFGEIRFPGVLQRIGVVFFFAALLYLHANWKVLAGIAVAILVGYWVWLGFIPLDGAAPTFERAPNNWANYIDVQVFGSHNYKADYDPEGLLSTFPAIVTSILGIFTGMLLVSKRANKVLLMAGAGLIMLLAGHAWDLFFPINKALWTSSFVLATAGWANLVLALIYYITDSKGIQFGTVFKQAGANAITVYFLSSFVTKLFYSLKVNEDTTVHEWLYQTIYVQEFLAPKFSSLLYGLSVVAFYMLVAYILYRRKIFIKV